MKILEMKGISKRFGPTVALDRVDFDLKKNEILSLLGENGAGKTTLMNILYGLYRADEGEIYFQGKEAKIHHPIDAINLHICMVHQHFMLVPALTITENVIAGSEPGNGLFIDRKKARNRVAELIKSLNSNLNPDTKVSTLSVAAQQQVEIIKALYRQVDVLILDEPTAVLTPSEVDGLFEVLRKLRDNGMSIIIITHKLKETLSIADRITVLRDGCIINNNVLPSSTNIHELSEMLVGRQIKLGIQRPTLNCGDDFFEVENLNVIEQDIQKVKDVSFSIKSGEILGIAGIDGNGQTQILEALTGLIDPHSLTMKLKGQKLEGNTNRLLRAGIGHIPEDRLKMGIVLDESVMNNLILGYHREPRFCQKGIFKSKSIKEFSEECISKFKIKTSGMVQTVKSLSGGNQQKVVIGRNFSQDLQVLIAAHPTRGVDVGAMEYIHNQILDFRDSGKAVLLVSADLDEVRNLSDRILIIYEGEIVTECRTEELTAIQMGMLMTGMSPSQINNNNTRIDLC